MHRRAATIVDSQSREGKHIRRGSLGAGFALGFGGTLGRRPRTPASAAAKGKAPEVKEGEEAEERPEDSEGEGVLVNREETAAEATEDDGSTTERDSKPLYLKGLFRLVSLS
jgi:serine/threonine protein kinase KIN1/2